MYRILDQKIVENISFGPYDNGPILIPQPGCLLGFSILDLSTLYRVNLETLDNINLKTLNIMVCIEPAQIIFLSYGREIIAIQMIEKEHDYMYV